MFHFRANGGKKTEVRNRLTQVNLDNRESMAAWQYQTVQHVSPGRLQSATCHPMTVPSSSISAFQPYLQMSGIPQLVYCSFPAPRRIVLDAAMQSSIVMRNLLMLRQPPFYSHYSGQPALAGTSS